MNQWVVRLYSMGRIIFGLLTNSKNCLLFLYIVINVEVVMVVGFINPLQYTVVAQQMESKGRVSIPNFLRFIQILRYLGNTCTPQYSRILTAVCFNFCVVCAAVANCAVHAGKKFNTQNEECMNISISIILPVYLPIHHVQ
jgi:hypothetical protein